MRFKGVKEMGEDIRKHLARLVRGRYDLVVGVPRSGLLPASLVALYLHLPFTDVEGLIAGRLIQGGLRSKFGNLTRPLHALVLDDSVLGGGQMGRTRRQIEAAHLPHRIEYAAIYGCDRGRHAVDFYLEQVEPPRTWGWNILQRPALGDYLVDLDGCLCRDPTAAENDDGSHYRAFVIGAAPLRVPAFQIGRIITCRLERYRALTEAWLRQHGYKWTALVMMQYDTAEERRRYGRHAEWKAENYLRMGHSASLFIESSHVQAQKIFALTRRPVFCTDTWEMFT